jgi:predicted transposase YdaD
LAAHRYKEPVWSVVVLLRPKADGPELTGEYEHEFPGRGRNVWFRYDVVRVWELPPQRLLEAGLPLLPLAPVSNVTAEQLPAVLTGVAQRLRDGAAPEVKKALWAATEILLGLYHSEERVKELTEEMITMILGIPGLEESSVYQGIFTRGKAEGKAEGRAEEAREILLSLGQTRLGQPDEAVQVKIAAIRDPDRLHLLIHRIFQAATWDELLTSTD